MIGHQKIALHADSGGNATAETEIIAGEGVAIMLETAGLTSEASAVTLKVLPHGVLTSGGDRVELSMFDDDLGTGPPSGNFNFSEVPGGRLVVTATNLTENVPAAIHLWVAGGEVKRRDVTLVAGEDGHSTVVIPDQPGGLIVSYAMLAPDQDGDGDGPISVAMTCDPRGLPPALAFDVLGGSPILVIDGDTETGREVFIAPGSLTVAATNMTFPGTAVFSCWLARTED